MENIKGKQRIVALDNLRAMAIFFVVLCHSTQAFYSMNADQLGAVSSKSAFFAIVVFTIGRMGVPLFLMLTGFLLLDREYDDKDIIVFWKQKWLRLLMCTVIWFVIYDLFVVLIQKQNIEAGVIIEDLLFIHDVPLTHTWYMPMILGIYLLIPFAANSLQQHSLKIILFPTIFFAAYAFGYPFFYVINNAYHPEAPLELKMNLGFSGGIYGIYLVAGYLIKKEVLMNIPGC